VANNNQLLNAAFIGFIDGALDGRSNLSASAINYVALVTAAKAFATQVDTKISRDNTMTDVSGSHLPPANNVITANLLSKVTLMTRICASMIAGRYSENPSQSSWDSVAIQVAAAYTQAITQLIRT
jgi:hypothetical protein